MTNMFWSRWTREYLPLLRKQKKWPSLKTNLTKGDLVLLCGKNLKRSHWPLGRIVETLHGPDNVVCVVKVQTKDISYMQSVASSALLECWNDRVGVICCVIVRYNSLLGWKYFAICV